MYNDSTPDNGENSSTGSFDIRDHLDKLEPSKGKNKYVCPVCSKRNLGIDPKTGAYQCWSGGCSTVEIKEAIRPLADFLAERKGEQLAPTAKKPRTKKKEHAPVPIPIGAKLLRLPVPEQSPQPEPLAKDTPREIPRNALQTTYDYTPTQKVVRYEWPDITNPKGHDKTYRQFHIDVDGKKVWKKGDARWPAYRIDEVVEILKTIPDGEPVAIAMPEGELGVELARSIRLAALTLQGSNWSDPETQQMLETLRATGKNVCLVVIRDNDDTGIKKGKGIELVARHIQFPCLVIDPRAMWADIPEKGDIREFLEAMEADEFLIRVEAEIYKAANSLQLKDSISTHPRTHEDVVCLSSKSSNDNYIPDTAPNAGQNFILKAEDALYSEGHYASIGGLLYRFTGSHYEELNESSEKRRIGVWLKTYSEKVKGVWVTNRADTASVNAVFSWVVNQNAVDPAQVNPGGLNCSNGVVKINFDGSHSLVPHEPRHIYTYVGCKYDPHINPANCYRLLECLEPPQRKIFLRTAAAALNLKLVRSKLTGRGVKGLLCHTAKVDLDNIQSLKQLITGDPIDIERKGKDAYEYKPAAIFFANCNKLPGITGGTAAIDDRYSILRFDKTYARNAIAAEGQLEADPRFKDDEKFILEQVAPAMLNELLREFPLLLSEGIDYKATRDAMQKAQEESRHLWQFAREVGLEVQAGGRVWVTDLWDSLVNWYEGMGILDKEPGSNGKEKLIWHDLPNKYDAPVKSINQLSARLSEIFPKVQVCKYSGRDEIERRHQRYLVGIGFVQNSAETAKTSAPSAPVYTARDVSAPALAPKNVGADVGADETLTQSGGADGADDFPLFAKMCKLVAQLTDAEWQELVELRTQSQPLPEKITPKDAQTMRDIALLWWHEYYPEQMQSLVAQMYGRGAPGTRYSAATLTRWFDGEVPEVRDHITELMRLRGN
jgi:putative DNA primase/helicase